MTTGDLAETLEDRWTRVGEYDVHLLATRHPAEFSLEVVYLAGFIVGGHSAIPLAAELARYYRLYAPDLPGYGSSTNTRRTLTHTEQADVIAGLLDALAVGSIALVANSFSAQIAVEFAVRHPQRLLKLALINPSVDSRARNALRQLIRFFKNSREENAVIPGMVSDYLRAGPRRILQTARYALRYPMEDKLPDVHAPTLVVRGRNDRIVSQSWVEEVVSRLPNGRLVEVPNYAHGIERVGVPILSRILRRFLDDPP